jgi:hypothetical protein
MATIPRLNRPPLRYEKEQHWPPRAGLMDGHMGSERRSVSSKEKRMGMP